MDNDLTGFVIFIMVIAGVGGGTVSYALSRPEKFEWRPWMWNLVAGLGASFLMPLFLRTVSSTLLSKILDGSSEPDDMLVFGAFCLLAAISSKTFIQTLSDRVLAEARRARQLAEQNREDIREASEKAKEAMKIALIAGDAAVYGVGPKPEMPAALKAALPEIQRGPDPDDPWAGQFGGRSESNHRRLEAILEPLPSRPDWCPITLRVRSTDPERVPLTGFVVFYLHEQTFTNFKPQIPVLNGVAELNIASPGAFTVGAMADEGRTLLELDLSKHPEAPESFRSRKKLP